ncbi:HIT family protein [Chromobacterium violaceum]|uniref:HIT family protein n=1 Tax=Chromobacterium violaceum TaxID=536 RepID=UPI0009BB6247|nr:HIT family protein [Chromobacterium violaceum]
MNCIFCKIAKKEEPSHLIWEDDKHMAFLSIFPNTPGFSVVIPKQHYSSYAFNLNDTELSELVLATKKVALLLDRSLDGVARTGMIFEGYGVDHVHAKLFPMHGTGSSSHFKKISSNNDKYFTQYEGYISSHDYKRASEDDLEKIAKHIRAFL